MNRNPTPSARRRERVRSLFQRYDNAALRAVHLQSRRAMREKLRGSVFVARNGISLAWRQVHRLATRELDRRAGRR